MTDQTFVLFCKSYSNDVVRARRLSESVQKFNKDSLQFIMSVPEKDILLFRDHLKGLRVELITDEEIVKANPALEQRKVDSLPGGLSQQIVKSEFWRLGLADVYLCIDSDCQFIRSFGKSDFFAPEGYPYTVMHEAKEILQFVVNHGMEKIYDYFHKEHAQLQGIMDRPGRAFEFGPPPMIWSASVWKALDDQFLKPRELDFLDAIVMFPAEIQWYGEAMLKYRPFPLVPVEPLFKFYHYDLQYSFGVEHGDSVERLAKNYLGVCYQSNWEKSTDLVPKTKPPLSRMWRNFRRKVLGRRI